MRQAHLPTYCDSRSEATKRQHLLFRQLGTLYRTRTNLIDLKNRTNSSLRQHGYSRALFAINLDIADVRYAMTQLPNKKRLAAKLAELNNQPKEKYEP